MAVALNAGGQKHKSNVAASAGDNKQQPAVVTKKAKVMATITNPPETTRSASDCSINPKSSEPARQETSNKSIVSGITQKTAKKHANPAEATDIDTLVTPACP